jgi:hypothetical protein
MKNQGNTSGGSKNNADGNSGGIWIDMNAVLTDVVASSQFDWATNGFYGWNGTTFTGSQGGDDTVAIYGDGLTDGIDLDSAFPMRSKAMVATSDQSLGGDGVNGYVPTAPVEGQIGPSGDTALGSEAHTKLRVYARSDLTQGGVIQFEWVIAYSFTA